MSDYLRVSPEILEKLKSELHFYLMLIYLYTDTLYKNVSVI